jgi:hypothetical protein
MYIIMKARNMRWAYGRNTVEEYNL